MLYKRDPEHLASSRVKEVEDFYRVFGQRVGQRRKFLRMTQAQVGARLSPPMTRASIANIEKGHQRVLAHTVVQLAVVLNLEDASALLVTERVGGLRQELKQKLSIPEDAVATILRRITRASREQDGNTIERTNRKARG